MFRATAINTFGDSTPSSSVYAAYISSPESVEVSALAQTTNIGLDITWGMPESSNRYAFSIAVLTQSGVGSTILAPNVTESNSSSNATAGAGNPVYSVVLTGLTAGAGYNVSYVDNTVSFHLHSC
jgi:hypothetical protein